MRRGFAVLALALMLAGCFGSPDPAPTVDPLADGISVRERHLAPFVLDAENSSTLQAGVFNILDPIEANVPFTPPVGRGIPTSTVNVGVFRPDVPAGTKVPVVADIGPYFDESDGATTERTDRLGGFLIDTLVPHGFAVAQISVSGTGRSGGCMDFMGTVEQASVDAAVRWLASQPWSNGNIGLIGRSYDGSTPWQAAAFPDTPVKTVVPISGLHGIYELMWKNGSAESRGPGLLWALYYEYTFSPPDSSLEYVPTFTQHVAEGTACPDSWKGAPEGVATYGTGSPAPPAADPYWTDRRFDEEVLANYKGSVYFIHGLEDWNVDPHMIAPFYQQLEAKGLDMKGLFGQWAHNYPDRRAEHKSCDGYTKRCQYPTSARMDWAQDLLEWFGYYLRGDALKPELHVEVQDGKGAWRIEDTYPPRDVTWMALKVGSDLAGSANSLGVGGSLTFTSSKFAQDTRISGLIQLPLTVTPQGPGGQIFAELRNVDENRHIGHAIMDLRYAAGGAEMKAVVPNQPLVARMEFFPAEDVVKAGQRIQLTLTTEGEDYMPSTVAAPILIDTSGASLLRLPTVDRNETAFFTPPTAKPG